MPLLLNSLARITLFASLFVLLLAPSAAMAQTKLEWKFKKGQHVNQEVEQNMDMTMAFGERKIKTSMNQKIDTGWLVESVDENGTATIAQAISRLRMTMKSDAGVQFDFDSKEDADKELEGIAATLGPALKGLAKAKFTVTMNSQGAVEKVEIDEATLASFKAVPGAAQMGGMFSKDGLINMIKQGGTDFPAKAIENGTSWKKGTEIQLPQVGKMKSDATMTYKGTLQVDNKTLQRIDIDLAIDLAQGDNAPAKVTLKDQRASGKLLFDNEKGWLQESEMNQVMTMQIKAGPTVIEQVLEQQVKAKMVWIKE